jgi:asparagine synthase (glutamine-hydrolysing)
VNLFVVGWNCRPAERDRALEALRSMHATFPLLDPPTLHRWDGTRGFAAWMHTADAIAQPRRYVHATPHQLVLYDGTLVDTAGDLATHDAAVLAANWNSLPERLEGRFAAARIDDQEDSLEVINDPFGLHPTFVHDGGTTWWLANSVRLLARVARLDTIDLEAMARHIGTYAPGGDRTLVEGATILPAAQRWRWSGNDAQPTRTTHWPAERLVMPKRSFRPRDAAELAAAMGGMLEQLSRTFAPLRCPITGGRDSRMMTGLTMANPQPTDYFTKGEPTDLDVVLGSAIAERFGLSHQRSIDAKDVLTTQWDEISRRVIQKNDGMVTLLHAENAQRPPDHLDRFPVLLYGAGGEMARGTRHTTGFLLSRPDVPQATAFVRGPFALGVGFLRPEARAIVFDDLDRVCRSLHERGFTPVDLPDALDVLDHGARWGGAQARQAADKSDVFLPFFTRAYVTATLRTPPVERLMERLPFLLIDHLSRELRAMPGQKPWPAQSVPVFLLAQALQVANKATERARRRLGLQPAPPSGRAGRRYAQLQHQLPRWRERYLDRSDSNLWQILDRGRFEHLTSGRATRAEVLPELTNLYQVATAFAYEEDFQAWTREASTDAERTATRPAPEPADPIGVEAGVEAGVAVP